MSLLCLALTGQTHGDNCRVRLDVFAVSCLNRSELGWMSLLCLTLAGQKHGGTCRVRLNVFAVSCLNRSDTW